MSEQSKNRPTHVIYHVTEKPDAKNFWQAIGAAWSHEDGQGFNLQLNHLPLTVGQIVMRVRKDKFQGAEAA